MNDESTWYTAVQGRQQGPLTKAELVARIRSGQLDRQAHVFTAGMANWVPIASVPDLAAAFKEARAVPPPPPVAGGAHEIDYEIFGAMQAAFGAVEERDGKLVSSFGALKEIMAWPSGKSVLGIETTMNKDVPDDRPEHDKGVQHIP